MTITYVCRQWRSAALGLRELWSTITPGLSIPWSQAMIERSFPLPMHIYIHFDNPFSTVGLKSLAVSELLSESRIRTLSLSGTPRVLEVLNRLSSLSPLESLSLLVQDTGVPIDLPVAVFNRDAPHLRRLTFGSSARIRAPLWLLAGITHFTACASLSLPRLLDTLKAMPRLEVLYVRRVMEVSCDIAVPGQVLSDAVLPRLSLRPCTLHRFAILSSHIDAPPTLRRHLHINLAPLAPVRESSANEFTDVQALIPHDSAPGVDDGGLRGVQVTGGPASGSFEVWSRTCSESASAHAGAFAREDALFLLRIRWVTIFGPSLDERRHFFYLVKLCAHLRTTGIEDLTVAPETSSSIKRKDPPDIVAQWQALLAALPAVKTLRLYRGSTACLPLLRALSESESIFPLLQKVFVVESTVRYAAASAEGCDVSGAETGSAMDSTKFMKANVGVELVEALSGRSGLEVLLIGCEVDEEALEALRKRARVEIGDEWVYKQVYM